jgi:hypothetical protein
MKKEEKKIWNLILLHHHQLHRPLLHRKPESSLLVVEVTNQKAKMNRKNKTIPK